mmetsp:Transcript_44202/g.117086  ORF Transcript_44202/g.117086 Transcript_44202/m.117086 type:complete len:206 (-) Transcript_44202:1162-1779(-)
MLSCTSTAALHWEIVNGVPVMGFVASCLTQSSNAARSKRCPSGVCTGSTIKPPLSSHTPFSGIPSATRSGTSSSSSESSSSSSSCSSGARRAAALFALCIAKSFFFLARLFLPFLHFFPFCCVCVAMFAEASRQKLNACTDFLLDFANGNRIRCSDVSRLLRRSWLSGDNSWKADCNCVKMASLCELETKSMLTESLTNSSIIVT